MKKSILFVGMFVTLFSFTTVGVVTAQYGGAQADKDKQKPAAKAHTMTGCLEKGTEADTFRLTNVEGTGPKTVELHAEALSLGRERPAGSLGYAVDLKGLAHHHQRAVRKPADLYARVVGNRTHRVRPIRPRLAVPPKIAFVGKRLD